MTTIHRPARLATRAASFRYGGRHHSGIPDGIIPLHPGGFVGIGINDGLIPGEQATPGAPWRIRMTDELKAKFTEAAGDGFVTMQEATRALGVTRQTVLQRVKRGEIEAAHVTKGGKRGLRIRVIEGQPTLFDRI